jgi:hypothetical protein
LIDFRYHLVSIVAVFLALGIGVLMGSAVLGENLIKDLRNDLKDIRTTNEDLRQQTLSLEEQLSESEGFASEIQPLLINGALSGRQVVIVQFEGTNGDFVDEIQSLIGESGGEITSIITFLEQASLSDDATVDQIALLLGSSESDPDRLRAELGDDVGDLIGKASLGGVGDEGEQESTAQETLEELATQLQEAGFIETQVVEEQQLVNEGATILVLVGSDSDPPFRINEFTRALGSSIAQNDVAVVLAESSSSIWAAVQMIRSDEDAAALVSTVDDAGSPAGGTATILTLEEAIGGVRGHHYGVGSGAESILPQPIPSS